jgi:hypothetical protein
VKVWERERWVSFRFVPRFGKSYLIS